jgi:hypothetical protein
MPQHRIFYGDRARAVDLLDHRREPRRLPDRDAAERGRRILAVSWAPAAQPGSGAATDSGAVDEDAAASDRARYAPAEPPERELVGAGVAADAHDQAVHAEFVPYPALIARARSQADDSRTAPPPFPQAARTAQRAPAAASTPRRKASPASGRKPGVATAVALLFVAALTGVGAIAAPAAHAAEPSSLCLPILMICPPPPSPSPSPSPSSGGGLVGGLVGGLLGGAKVPGASSSTAPLVIGPDDSAYPMTLPAGQLGGSSISISGIHQVGLVTVKKLDGSSFAVIKLKADDVVITGFLLDVRRATGPALVSSADRMELKGNVSVWLDSLTGTTLGGLGLTLGTDQTPPPSSELPPRLLRVNLGLVATSADSISYVNLHQELHG